MLSNLVQFTILWMISIVFLHFFECLDSHNEHTKIPHFSSHRMSHFWTDFAQKKNQG